MEDTKQDQSLTQAAQASSLPEVYNDFSQPQYQSSQHQLRMLSPQPETINWSQHPSAFNDARHDRAISPQPEAKKHTPRLVTILSIVIALLCVAVAGLAAGTGVAASNYKAEHDKLTDLQAQLASKTTSAPSASHTGYSSITNGCSDDTGTTGSTYKPEFFGKPMFTIYCNRDASNPPFYSLFTADFSGCMSACASWNSYNASNSVCEAVSFIPLWTDIVSAVKGKAPGNCYIKPGPQSVQKLQIPNIGPNTECHAALLYHNATMSKT